MLKRDDVLMLITTLVGAVLVPVIAVTRLLYTELPATGHTYCDAAAWRLISLIIYSLVAMVPGIIGGFLSGGLYCAIRNLRK